MLDRFIAINKFYLHHRSGRANEVETRAWHMAQVEAYELAQAITKTRWPQLDSELRATRRRIVEIISPPTDLDKRPKRKLRLSDPAFASKKRESFPRWSEIRLTPELDFDQSLTGIVVPRALAGKLIKLHREQVKLLTNLIMEVG